MKKPKRYLITSALPYANGPLHVGHLAGAYIPADIYVKYLKLMGEDVIYICGSDEHGAAITIQAKKEGIKPQEIIDKYHLINKKSFKDFGISFDIYHRTSANLHHETAKAFFTTLNEKSVFDVQESDQYYDTEFNQFLADRYIKGICPKCAYPEAYGDQCEKCGSDLSPTDLINPISTLSGKSPILKQTKHWYLPMDKYQKWIEVWVENQNKSEKWKKHVIGQCRSWLTQGLNKRAMTRDLDWGVKLPIPDSEGKVLYVWLDAPIGYISATKALTKNWENYWKDPDTKLVHFIGKDNIVFHCIIFPILLHAHGEFILPNNIPANQFMNLEGEKISTSKNWAVWLHEYLEDFPNRQDILRYYLIANMPENKDSDFSWNELKNRNNNELVGLLGGSIHRTIVLVHKYFKGKVPVYDSTKKESFDLEFGQFKNILNSFAKKLDKSIQEYEFRSALFKIMNLAKEGNKMLAQTEPWKLIKEDKDKTAYILNFCVKIVACLSVYLEPFLPNTSVKLRELLQLNEELKQQIISGDYQLPEEHKFNEPYHLFIRIDQEEVGMQLSKLNKSESKL